MIKLQSAIFAAFAMISLASPPAFAQQSGAATKLSNADIYARYEPLDEIATEQLANGQFRARVPLAAIRAAQGPMRLEGALATETLGLAIAPQADVKTAKLIIRHVTGRGQASADAHLRIGLNRQFIAQLDAATSLTAAMDEITLDPRLFKPGFNLIEFDAVQRYTFECQDPLAAELWTEIDTLRSEVEIVYERRDFNASLADIDAFLSPGIGGVENLVIATAAGDMSADHLEWGALISQTVANHLAYRLPDIDHTEIMPDGSEKTAFEFSNGDLGAGADLVLIGTFDEIGHAIAVDPATVALEDGYVALRPSPFDASRFMFVIAGHTPEAVSRAVNAISLATFPFADDQETRITELDAPEGVTLGDEPPLQTGVAYAFSDLGYETQSFRGFSSANMAVELNLPADTYFEEDDDILLSLDFAYGAGLNTKSVLNIMVNGSFRAAVPLQNPRGEAASGYEVRLPARAFKAGRNRIDLEAELSKDQQGACSSRNDRHLAFMIENSSILHLPETRRFVELPNLKIFSESGYPYTKVSAQPFSVRVADRSSETVAAAWTLVARLGQIHKDQYRGVDFEFAGVPAETHTLLIGPRRALSEFSTSSMSLQSDLSTLVRVRDRVALKDSVTTSQVTGLGRNGLLISGENPASEDTLLTVLTAQSSAGLLQAARNLVGPSHWSQLNGSSAVWRSNPATFGTMPAVNSFFVGDLDPRTMVKIQNSRRPWMFILAIGAFLFLAAGLLSGVASYLRRQLKSES
jgi:hypothetical protein